MAETPARRTALQVEVLEVREMLSASTWLAESFETAPLGGLPAGWSQWDSGPAFAVVSGQGVASSRALASTSASPAGASRAWVNPAIAADGQVSASLSLAGGAPGQVLARGTTINSTTPTYYALSVTPDLSVQLLRVVNGTSTVLGQVQAASGGGSGWVRLLLDVSGSTIRAQVFHTDTGTYLNDSGQWQAGPAWVLSATDTAITGVGQAGVARPTNAAGTLTLDDFAIDLPGSLESFDTTAAGSTPPGWASWSSNNTGSFTASPGRSLSGPNGFVSSGNNVTSRSWLTTQEPANLEAGAALYLDSLIPARLFVRGRNLNTSTPSFYALQLTRGLQAQIVRVVNGVATTLASLSSADFVNPIWVRAILDVQGTGMRARIYRTDRGQYLNSAGQWQSTPAWALTVYDWSLSGPGFAGLERPASYAGPITFDDFTVLPGYGDSQAPTSQITVPKQGSVVSGVSNVQVSATDTVGVAKVEFYLDNVLQATSQAAPYTWAFYSPAASNGLHTIKVIAYDLAGNKGISAVTVTTQNANAVNRPNLPRHYTHLRIAELAYGGTTLGPFEDQLLQNSVDLVVPVAGLFGSIHAVAPNTPQLLYTNVSNLYLQSLADWINYAEVHGLDPEQAFYHAAQATPFVGSSPSSQPVTWFWAAYRGGATLTAMTGEAHGGVAGGISLGGSGQSFYLGSLEPFREINFNLVAPRADGWTGVLEYPTAVDAAGNPTAWATLPTLSNTTNGWANSGQVLFDPPADWKSASVGGSTRLFYVRVRTLTPGTAPKVWSILGRDYVGARGSNAGVIPAFDASADLNHDGYLDDAEYAHRRPGMDARFLYESRLFAGTFGQMRFAANPSSAAFQAWAADYETRLLKSEPLAAGLFIDNSAGLPPVPANVALESVANYASDYAALMNCIAVKIAPKWVLLNTGGGGPAADLAIRGTQGYFEEFALRPLAQYYQQFEALAGQVARRSALRSPAPYAVIDSYPTGGSVTDPRTQLATLAAYYLLADPVSTFLDFFGGFEPATSWTRHWTQAAAFNVGQPQDTWSVFATGTDPSNSNLTYRVYQRHYGNALVLYKPLSSNSGGTAGTLADNTATVHQLGRTYRPLQADGTLGAAVTSISLRNGEGAILIPS
jgi:hypothetical protein